MNINMRLLARWGLVALLALALAVVLWRLTRSDPQPSVTVSRGEVKILVTGPGTVQARVPASA